MNKLTNAQRQRLRRRAAELLYGREASHLAVDTNVLLDLADEVDDVLDAASVIDGRLPDADKLVTSGRRNPRLPDFGRNRPAGLRHSPHE